MILTERTYIRAMEYDDIPLKVKWLNNPIVRETLFLRFPASLAESQLWYQKTIQDSSRTDLIICLKENNNPIGYAGYVNIDWVNRKAEPFIAIGETNVWGKGFGTEVVHSLLKFGFNELGLNRLYGYMLSNNPGALKMDLKAGFEEEGVLKQDVMLHGRFLDRIMLGATRENFNKRFNYI